MSTSRRDERVTSRMPLREQVAATMGPDVAKRIKTFQNGAYYVEAGRGAVFLAWLVDLFLVFGLSVGAAVAYYNTSYDAAGASVVFLASLIAVPLLYGWCYANGRGLGALLAGTRLVRAKDGSRIGLAKGGWAMLVRTLGCLVLLIGALSGAGADGGEIRVSIDDRADARLRATGLIRRT
ncbi:RDD family protein [Saccharothrix obliqua]|uniref:RDD family protein n=1 Tax=Saccharothrix obliqua TaxID=2861747 RepID=UPI001C5F52F8|nr:RDD family protein [Saccharothrix obliqua]MBW4718177.1 RDD family protein [Saccharothrix obliqua]